MQSRIALFIMIHIWEHPESSSTGECITIFFLLCSRMLFSNIMDYCFIRKVWRTQSNLAKQVDRWVLGKLWGYRMGKVVKQGLERGKTSWGLMNSFIQLKSSDNSQLHSHLVGKICPLFNKLLVCQWYMKKIKIIQLFKLK